MRTVDVISSFACVEVAIFAGCRDGEDNFQKLWNAESMKAALETVI